MTQLNMVPTCIYQFWNKVLLPESNHCPVRKHSTTAFWAGLVLTRRLSTRFDRQPRAHRAEKEKKEFSVERRVNYFPKVMKPVLGAWSTASISGNIPCSEVANTKLKLVGDATSLKGNENFTRFPEIK